jgi:dinuclear metal center YbgI/SA1388 family protein
VKLSAFSENKGLVNRCSKGYAFFMLTKSFYQQLRIIKQNFFQITLCPLGHENLGGVILIANGQTIIQFMEQFAPKRYALADDSIGLQLGTLNKPVSKVLVALDVTIEVIAEAIQEKAELIIAHHAIMYRPIKHLRLDLPAGKLYEGLIKNDIAVYIAHTNLDVADGGVNDILASAIGLEQLSGLQPVHTERMLKLVVFVPEDHQLRLQEALFSAGAGWIGNYSHCSFNVEGMGTFMPEEGTDPYLGIQGRVERVREIRLETVLPESLKRKVVQAMIKAHPYEEVAYDLYPMDLKGRSFGIGRVGKLAASVVLSEFVQAVKAAYGVPYVRVVGDLNRMIRKVAVLGGSGRDYVKDAIFAGADVLITGDIDYHTAHDALAAGFCIIDAGHNIEKMLKPAVANILNEKLQAEGYSTSVMPSEINTEPFQFV